MSQTVVLAQHWETSPFPCMGEMVWDMQVPDTCSAAAHVRLEQPGSLALCPIVVTFDPCTFVWLAALARRVTPFSNTTSAMTRSKSLRAFTLQKRMSRISPYRVWVKYTTTTTAGSEHSGEVALGAWKVTVDLDQYSTGHEFDLPLISLIQGCMREAPCLVAESHDPGSFSGASAGLELHQSRVVRVLETLEASHTTSGIQAIVHLWSEAGYGPSDVTLYLRDNLLWCSCQPTNSRAASLLTLLGDRPGTGRKGSVLHFLHSRASIEVDSSSSSSRDGGFRHDVFRQRLVASRATMILVTSTGLRRWRRAVASSGFPFKVHVVSLQQNDLSASSVSSLTARDIVLVTDTYIHSDSVTRNSSTYVIHQVDKGTGAAAAKWSSAKWWPSSMGPQNPSVLLTISNQLSGSSDHVSPSPSSLFPWMVYWKRMIVDESYLSRWDVHFRQACWFTDHCVLINSSPSRRTLPWPSTVFGRASIVLHKKDAFCVLSENSNVHTFVDTIPMCESDRKLVDNYTLTPKDLASVSIDLPSLSGIVSPHMTTLQAERDQQSICQQGIDKTNVIIQYYSSLSVTHSGPGAGYSINHSKLSCQDRIDQARQWIKARQTTLERFRTNLVSGPASPTCAMCLSNHADVIFDCGHWCCLRCAEVYLLQKSACPWCRRRLHQGYRICNPTIKWSLGNKMQIVIAWINKFVSSSNGSSSRSDVNPPSILLVVRDTDLLRYISHVLGQHLEGIAYKNCLDDCREKRKLPASGSLDATAPYTPCCCYEEERRRQCCEVQSKRALVILFPLSFVWQVSKSAYMERNISLFSQCSAILCLEELYDVDKRHVFSLVSNTRHYDANKHISIVQFD